MSAAIATEQVQQLGEDEAQFIGELKLITAIQHVVIPKPGSVAKTALRDKGCRYA